MRLSPYEYLIAGKGVVAEFKTATEFQQEHQQTLGEDGFAQHGSNAPHTSAIEKSFTGKRIGIGTVDEVSVNPDGSLNYLRRLCGDQTHQGRHVRIGVDAYQILHVKLYKY